MKTEEEIREEYDELLDNYGHTFNLSIMKRNILIEKIELLEWVLNIKASELKVIR